MGMSEDRRDSGADLTQGEETRTASQPSGGRTPVNDAAWANAPAISEIPGRYEEVREHARGGIGRVLIVRDTYLGREIALKELLPAQSSLAETATPASNIPSDPSTSRRFLREAKVTGQLEHPAIVPVYELGRREDGTPYYTMKFVHGRTLKRAIADAGALQDRLKLLSHFLDLCQALAYAHSRGVIHRDIKPSNVLIGEFGETVVVDWGLAKLKGEADDDATPSGRGRSPVAKPADDGDLTQEGEYLGTPSYMPPEQALGDIEQIDERSDVYGLGTVLYELLTGRRPHVGSDAAEILMRVIHDAPTPVQDIEAAAPAELVAICSRAMSKRPEERYRSARELADEVQRFLTGGLVQAHAYTLGDLVMRFVRRHKAAVVTSALGVVAFLVVAVVSYVNILQARNREREQRVAAEEANRGLVWENYAGTLGIAAQRIEDRAFPRARELLYAAPPEHRHWEWGRTLREAQPALAVIAVGKTPDFPDGSLHRTVLSPDGRYLLTDRPGFCTKSVFDLETETTVAYTDAYCGWRECTGFMPDGKSVHFGTSADTVSVFDWTSGELEPRFQTPGAALRAFVISGTPPVAIGLSINKRERRCEIVLWDIDTGEETRRIDMGWGDHFAAGPLDAALGSYGARLKPSPIQLLGLADGNRLLVYATDRLSAMDLETEEIKSTAPRLGPAALSAGSPVGACLTQDGHLTVWDTRTGALVSRSPEPIWQIRDLAISGDGRYVAAASDTLWRLYDAQTGALVREHHGCVDIRDLAFSPNDACVMVGSDSEIHFWGVAEERDVTLVPVVDEQGKATGVRTPDLISGGGRPFAYNHRKDRLATTNTKGALHLWSAPEFKRLRSWRAHEAPIREIAFNFDDTLVATASSDVTAKVWDVATGACTLTVSVAPRLGVMSVAFSPDGQRLAVGTGEGIGDQSGKNDGRMVDLATGEVLFLFAEGDEPVNELAFTPDGRWLLAGTGGGGAAGGLVQVLDAATGRECLGEVEGVGVPWYFEFTADSRYALISGGAWEPILWDLREQREVWRLERAEALQVALHPSGERFALMHVNNRVSIHALSDGRELMIMDQGCWPATFSLDGRDFICPKSIHINADHSLMQIRHTDDWTVVEEADAHRAGMAAVRSLMELD
uniref:WD-repeat protein n=1 Tax=uncultured bacterium FLS12 TaxID=651659 RepID=C5HLA6_9BACT|nr:WD-repeat protein [uncultured bacterium FLS12]